MPFFAKASPAWMAVRFFCPWTGSVLPWAGGWFGACGSTARAAVWLSQDGKTWKTEAWAYRCHIVGPAFTAMRSLAQEKNPENEIACAWQLAAEGWTKTEEILPVPEKIPGGPLELHLDHPWLHEGNGRRSPIGK